MRASGGADDVKCVMHICHPIAQRLVHRVLQRASARRHRHHLGPEQLHAENVWSLSRHVGRAHEDDAGQTKARTNRRRRHAMLASTGFRDDPGFAHAHGEQYLADAIVDLVRAGMVEFVTLEPHLRAAQFFGNTRCEIERAGPAYIMFEQIVKLGGKGRVRLGAGIFRLKLENERHQRFRHIAPAKLAKMAAFVGPSPKTVGIAEAVGGGKRG